jgi:hypothetical protein
VQQNKIIKTGGVKMKSKWYLQTWIICICFAFWFFVIPGILGIYLLVLHYRQLKENRTLFDQKKKLLNDIGAERYSDVTDKISKMEMDYDFRKVKIIDEINRLENDREAEKQKILASIATEKAAADDELAKVKHSIEEENSIITQLKLEIERLTLENETLDKQSQSQKIKISKIKELYKSVSYAIENFFNYNPSETMLKIPDYDLTELESISPSVILKLHSMDVKDLRKAFNENNKLIDSILTQYSSRYTTKANQAIYKLMVVALRAELQNILTNLKYEKLDKSLDDVKKVTDKYLKIASDGNQSIAGTLSKFIGEIEYLFINATKIEYNYYVKKEQAKQEQLSIRQQMREEAEERKLLEQQRKQVEKEEEKYNNEIAKLQETLSSTTDLDKLDELNKRILELQSQLSDVVIKKEEISKLQNGKAGNVYIISNLGSFGESIFKIGMTRRIDPQERIDELGSASVPFRFDVHSFIFSDNAVDMEKQLHTILKEKRVNKVNLRKEFFNTTIDELEQLVTDIEPTAEFNKTMLAEEFRQSLSSDELYETDEEFFFDDEEELSQ